MEPLCNRHRSDRNADLHYFSVGASIRAGDFPDPKQFRDACSSGEADILAFASLSSRDVAGYMDALDDVLKRELPCVSQIREL